LSGEAYAVGESSLAVRRAGRGDCWIVCSLEGRCVVDLEAAAGARRGPQRWEMLLSTEDAAYATAPVPIGVELAPGPVVTFERPGAVILRSTPVEEAAGGGQQ
jgi:hypothetical protein